MQAPDDLEELRVYLDRMRTLLDNLVVRGLRACGPDELDQLTSFAEHLEQTGAGHLASLFSELREQVERDDRTSARAHERTNVTGGAWRTAFAGRCHWRHAACSDARPIARPP